MNELDILDLPALPDAPARPANSPDHIVEYYSDAGMDYEAWSRHFNMHFGYWRPGVNPLRLEGMLEEMNEQVLGRLQLDGHPGPRVLDLGCGLGATLCHAARTRPAWDLTGITLVPWQILKKTNPMNPLYRFCYRYTCDFWAMENFAGLNAFTDCLKQEGFVDIQAEEISWQLAPSVFHVPRVTLKYFFTQLFHPRHRMTRESWRHVIACVLSPFIGLARKRFGYYLVTAVRGNR